jgi:hypothetical protein
MLHSWGTQRQVGDNLLEENTFILSMNFQMLFREHIFSFVEKIYLPLPQAKPFGTKDDDIAPVHNFPKWGKNFLT